MGPLLDSIEKSLLDVGYARATVQGYLLAIGSLARWLARQGIPIRELDEKVIESYMDQARRGRSCRDHLPALRMALQHLRKAGVVPGPPEIEPPSPVDDLLRRYEHYLRVERGLNPATVTNYGLIARSFLFRQFGDGPIRFREITPATIHGFLLSQAETLSHGRALLMTTTLRSLFRYLLQQGEIDQNLGAAVLPVANRPRAVPVKFLTPEEVANMLAACDLGSRTGRRDHALLLLLARLGLRGCEAVALNLDDIDWRAGEILVPGKEMVHERLPLPVDVGVALSAYVRHDRPRAPTRRVFLCMKGPHRGLGHTSTVSTIVRRAIDRAGLDPPRKGAHTLRHALAIRMLRQGASMAEIGQILRHHSANTTEIYAKVDFQGLRPLALPWPGSGGGR